MKMDCTHIASWSSDGSAVTFLDPGSFCDWPLPLPVRHSWPFLLVARLASIAPSSSAATLSCPPIWAVLPSARASGFGAACGGQ